MWSGRIIAPALLAGCASLPSPQQSSLEGRVAALLEARGLGAEALLVVDNVLRHGPPHPPAAPPLVLELLAQPLAAADAARIFRDSVPASLSALQPSRSADSFDGSLNTYLAQLAEAQGLLRSALRPFDDEPLLRELSAGLPSSARLLALADSVDAGQLERANRLFVDATVRFASRTKAADLEPQTFESAIGTVVIGTRGNDHHGPGAALIIDPGGEDVYERAPARNGTVSVIVDLGGNDEYRGADVAIRALSAIIELSGDDRYAMEASGLGAALAGASLLVDFAGNDTYAATFFAQGAAGFGIGALLDLGGDDRYRVQAWGQGFGIASGVGLLWDRLGEDIYVAGGAPDPFGRGAGLSGAQGAGVGPRGRLGGGTGILRDDTGDDAYEAQMFAQGSGYYYGLGLLWDRGGADRYQAYRYAQGNAAHQAVGVLRDEGGDDRYAADWYAQGMGLDVAVGVLVDAAGDDAYVARGGSQASATANGFGLLVDDDAATFHVATDEYSWGRAEWLRGLPSVGVLLHGNDADFNVNARAVNAPPDLLPVKVQPRTATSCPSSDSGEALVCRVREAKDVEAVWRELTQALREDPKHPLAGWIAVALEKRPPANANEVALLLATRESCNVRALALRAWPTLEAAREGIGSGCYRLQAAARAAYERLGLPLPADAALPAFLRLIPPQEDTY
jgi:hypothetical protein